MVNQIFSAAIQSLMPPVLWNVLQRARGRSQKAPWREFGNVVTCTNSKPLLEGKFAELYAKYQPLDPFVPMDVTRYRQYNICFFADFCRNVPGDFICAGVSWGLTPRLVFDFVDFHSLGKVLHLIDPFEGIVSTRTGEISQRYNRDPDYVLRQYPADAPIKLHRERVPLRLPGKFAFIFCDVGDPAADADSMPLFYESLNPGGVLITEQYANNPQYYEPVFAKLGVRPLWLPSGQGVLLK